MTQDNSAQTKRIIVDNKDRPMDVRPGVERLLQRIDDMLLTLPEDQTLYVAIGEAHNVSYCHAFFDAAVSAAKKQSYSMGVSLEIDFDTLYRAAKQQKPGIKPEIKSAMLANDPNNQFALHTRVAKSDTAGAPVANRNSSVHMLRSALPVNFHDTSEAKASVPNRITNSKAILNQDDTSTRDLIASLAPQALDKPLYTVHNPTADLVRNNYAFNSMEDFAKQEELRVVFVKSGVAHLCGAQAKGYVSPTESSLNGIAQTRGHSMISVVPVLAQDFTEMVASSVDAFESDRIIQIVNADTSEFVRNKTGLETTELGRLEQIAAASDGAYKLYDLEAQKNKSSKISTTGKLGTRIKQAQTQTKNLQRLARKAAGPS